MNINIEPTIYISNKDVNVTLLFRKKRFNKYMINLSGLYTSG